MLKTLLVVGSSLLMTGGCKSTSDDVKLSKPPTPSSERMESRVKDSAGLPVKLAMDELTAGKKLPALTITSPAFESMKPIPATYSAYGEKCSPPLKIGGVPANAKSLLIICDDPDAAEPKPFVHWVIWNVPATTTDLREAIPGSGQVRQLMNAKQGMNSAGSFGYTGPKPPIGDPPHHYHFQVFALDTLLPVEQAATKADLVSAAKDHVVAAGELVGTFVKSK